MHSHGITRRGVCIDAFCGWGGLALGMEQAGFDAMIGIDSDPTHAASHAFNFSYGRAIAGDLSTMSGAEIRENGLRQTEVDAFVLGRIPGSDLPDLMVGGPPCQAFSQMGKRDENDPRAHLVAHFARLVQEIQPRYAVMENVPGMIQGHFGPLLDELIENFLRHGYNVVVPKVLSAADYGVPQLRDRLLLMVYRQGETAPDYPEITHSRTADLILPKTPSVDDALADLPLADDFEELFQSDCVDASGSWGAPGAYALRMRGLSNDPDDLSHRRPTNPGWLTCSKRTKHSQAARELYAATPPGQRVPSHKLHRLAADGYSLTLRAGTTSAHGGHTAARPVHYTQPRVITVREGARLHSIPDAIRLSTDSWTGFRLLGNSVPPLLGRAIGHAIRKAAGLNPGQSSTTLEPGDERLLQASSRDAAELLGRTAA